MSKDVKTGNFLQFRAVLEQKGATIQDGAFARIDFLKLYEDGQVINCNGNNANNPYFACALPKSPEQLVPDFLEVPNPNPHDPEPLHVSIHFQASQAIVLVGTTPPEVKYFSYVPFLVTSSRLQSLPITRDDPRLERQPIRNKPVELLQETRRILFGGLGDPLNLLKFKTQPAPDAPFEQPYVLIYAADHHVMDEVKVAARQAGYPEACINEIVISPELATLGVSLESDTFSFAHRISNNPTHPHKLKKYMEHPPVDVFRVTMPQEPHAPLPTPFLSPRGNGKTELECWRLVENLRQAILQEHEKDFRAVELLTDIWLDESYLTIQQGVDNLGESRDAAYFATETFVLPEKAFMVAYGVNHAKSGKAIYSNLVVYGDPLDNGVVTVQDDEFDGSASTYLHDPKQSNGLYAWRLGFQDRLFRSSYTTIPKVDTHADPPLTPPYALYPADHLYLGFRAYVDPATKVGPAWHELIMDRVIVFLPK